MPTDNDSMQLSPETKTLAANLIDGIAKTIVNADELYDEACLLAGAGHIARALLLHQISLEECGKAELLYASLTQVLSGHPIDLKKLSKVLATHAAKNIANAYFLPLSEAEVSAMERGDLEASVSEFSELKRAFHTESNVLKNGALYVDFDGTFKAPSELITQELLADILKRNREFMSMAMDKLRLLVRWAPDLDAAADEVNAVWTALSAVHDHGNPEAMEECLKRLEGILSALRKNN